MDANIRPPPDIKKLLVIVKRLWASDDAPLPGGTATQAEIDEAQKGSVDKGEPLKSGLWPTTKEAFSSSSTASKG
ncbi:benzoate 4-monooxygenase cytochrome P450 [Fusarium tjaetaba]|uniref:Benzoate 4-monooxygenase cytochrome P450 n=1 Tax=Fusarium tjaetaba TaxID=1567544 RepID=A0A8H5VXP5_9HYPO|nr:benzoate 4-monooxygenase cytochrome P450 [Fusarium tjaetaba]KAF5637324.1 benzoate 4-monooxygenase cytochrome P450 [Fusarium tjaetaba]